MKSLSVILSVVSFAGVVACAAPEEEGTTGDDQNQTASAAAAGKCFSQTLDEDVDKGTCVQDSEDKKWFRCSTPANEKPFATIAGPEDPSCKKTVPLPGADVCSSGTLGRHVSPGVCVQDSEDQRWFRCEGTKFKVLPNGPDDTCKSEFPFGRGTPKEEGFCRSPTLENRLVSRDVCVQNGKGEWFKCAGVKSEQDWDILRNGPVDACTAVFPFGR